MNVTIQLTGELIVGVKVDHFPSMSNTGREFYAINMRSAAFDFDLLLNREHLEQLYSRCGQALLDSEVGSDHLEDRDPTQPPECVAPVCNQDGTLFISE